MQVFVDKIKLYVKQPNENSLKGAGEASKIGVGSAEAQIDLEVARSTNSGSISELEDVIAALRDRELQISPV